MASATSNDPGLLVLVSLASSPRHGHAILLDIADFAGVRLGPGTLYGAIGRLESDGLIEAIAPRDGGVRTGSRIAVAPCSQAPRRIGADGPRRASARGGGIVSRVARVAARALLRAYPHAWRDRYGRSARLIEEADAGIGDVVDLAAGAAAPAHHGRCADALRTRPTTSLGLRDRRIRDHGADARPPDAVAHRPRAGLRRRRVGRRSDHRERDEAARPWTWLWWAPR